MKKHLLKAAVVASMVVGAMGAGATVAAAPAGASVVRYCGVSNPDLVEPAPAQVIQGFQESNTNVSFFKEQHGVTLGAPLPVDITPPLGYPQITDGSNPVIPGLNVAAGTKVDSYFIYSDPVGQPLQQVHYTATFTFSSPILGIVILANTLDATDGVVGNPGTIYNTSSIRGLELNQHDSVNFVSPTTLTVNLATDIDIDSVRVITAASLSPFDGSLPRYTEVASDGGIFTFGSQYFGSMGGSHINQPMVGGAETCSGPGYWTVASDGGVFTFGGAPFFGSPAGGRPINKPVVAMAGTPDGLGYWLAASDGGVFAFGDGFFHGSAGGMHLNKPIVAMAATPDGKGYWLVGTDGGIFNYGDAGYFGSHGGSPLNAPIVAMAATPDGLGYWLFASDGGVFTYGDAAGHYYGSHGGSHLNAPIVAAKAAPGGNGYWLIASDGGVFSYGPSATYLGSMGNSHLNKPIVGAF